MVWGAVDSAVGVTGAYSIDILGISHHAVRTQHAGCSKGGSYTPSEGIWG